MMYRSTISFCILALLTAGLSPSIAQEGEHLKRFPGGCIQVPGEEGRILPLLHTAAQTRINGLIAQTTLEQSFKNDSSNTLELTYVFPMPHRAAVGHYQFTIGERTIVGTIQTRKKAREMYEQARQEGKTAALLEQQRPNMFTQNLTNVPAGATIDVQIRYDEVVTSRDGQMEWVLPMVVGPRFMPETTSSSPITNPQYAWPNSRPTNTISLNIELAPGEDIAQVTSSSHGIQVLRGQTIQIQLDTSKTIPNKDFILNYQFNNKTPNLIASKYIDPNDPSKGNFILTLLPPNPNQIDHQIMPREFFFILDVSGSMYGQPMDQAIATLKACMGSLRPEDTFQIMTFAGSTAFFKPEPVHPTAQNLGEAMDFLNSRQSGGGTYMLKAIQQALTAKPDPERYRMAVMFTDGYIGNESEIIAAIEKLKSSSRMFGFGIGSSVNRFLLEGIGRAGNGFSEIVTLNADLVQTAKRWENRLRSPILTNLELSVQSGEAFDLQPKQLPDLFAGDPVLISGHFNPSKDLTLALKGKRGMEKVHLTESVTSKTPQNPVIPKIWARERIRDLNFDLMNPKKQGLAKEIESEITKLGLNYRLMTEFTSFIAVDSQSNVSTEGRVNTAVETPLPEGVSPRMLGLSRYKRKGMSHSISSPAPMPERREMVVHDGLKDQAIHKLEEPMALVEAEELEQDDEVDRTSEKSWKCELIFAPGKSKPEGLAISLTSKDDISGMTLVNVDGSIRIQLKPKHVAKTNNGSYKIVFTRLKDLGPGSWILNLGNGQTFEFNL